jgi:AraC-like DNA-binding protein
VTTPILYRTPGPALSGSVDAIWLCDPWEPPHDQERRLPDGSMDLVIDLDDQELRVAAGDGSPPLRLRGPVISGAHTRSFLIDTTRPRRLLGLHFRAGGAFPFLGHPAGMVQDAHVELSALWGRAAHDLHGRLLDARTPEARFDVLEDALTARLATARPAHPSVDLALRRLQTSAEPPRIGELAAESGVSWRRFIELFRAEVGLTPKVFWRLRRFQDVLRRAHAGEEIDWAEAALDCGYADQAHCIRDFRAFSGLNPTAYVARRSEHRNHVPVPGGGLPPIPLPV